MYQTSDPYARELSEASIIIHRPRSPIVRAFIGYRAQQTYACLVGAAAFFIISLLLPSGAGRSIIAYLALVMLFLGVLCSFGWVRFLKVPYVGWWPQP